MKQTDEMLINGILKVELNELIIELHKEKAYFKKDIDKKINKYSQIIINKLKEFIE